MPDDPPLQDRLARAKIQLKKWEYSFLKAHGRKPAKADIEADAIAGVYREYAKLQKALKSPKPPKPKPADPFARAPAAADEGAPATPTKQNKHGLPPDLPISATPKRSTAEAHWGHDIYESPPASIKRQRLFGNIVTRDEVGPTPQKTGTVLGIFDSFIGAASPSNTPTKPSTAKKRPHAAAGSPDTFGTPTKRNEQRVSASPNDGDDARFTTPRKRKRGHNGILDGGSPLKKDIFATPVGLKRWAPPPDAGIDSPPAFRPPPRPTRGLTHMLTELRELTEHAFDEEEEAMREMEAESAGHTLPPKTRATAAAKMPVIAEEEPGEQPPDDIDGDGDGPVQPVTGRDGFDTNPELPPLPPGAWVEEQLVDENEGKTIEGRTWKKKGLKRQTRRVKMRPVTYKTTDTGEPDAEASDASASSDASEFDGEDGASDDDDTGEKAAKRAKKAADKDVSTAATAAAKKQSLAAKGKEAAAKGKEVVKKAARKISGAAHAHMNFRKLNIKNKNSKGKGGGRFGRRR
ncbi:DNA replication/checkpoint protein [Geopyxis carbonaria]|nr:DNA replication/checkpoint protein [Geopyxis carbonaria]